MLNFLNIIDEDSVYLIDQVCIIVWGYKWSFYLNDQILLIANLFSRILCLFYYIKFLIKEFDN